jgi:hypothetical protein
MTRILNIRVHDDDHAEWKWLQAELRIPDLVSTIRGAMREKIQRVREEASRANAARLETLERQVQTLKKKKGKKSP